MNWGLTLQQSKSMKGDTVQDNITVITDKEDKPVIRHSYKM